MKSMIPNSEGSNPANFAIIGSCSVCGGPVCMPMVYKSDKLPIPWCQRCGAVKDDDFGPTIKMRPVGCSYKIVPQNDQA